MTIFIRSGSSASLKVPLGIYGIKYASGLVWYGYDDLFRSDTYCGKADKDFKFEVDGDQIAGYSISLNLVPNGNLNTSRISAYDF